MNLLCLALVAVLAAPAPSAADAAAALFAQGRSEFAEGRYDTALDRFSQADALVPHPATKFHIAQCLAPLGRLREAWQQYGLVAEHPEVSPQERDAAARARAAVRSRLASVRVTGQPGGRVTIDEKVACTSPCTAVVDPGLHDLRVTWPHRAVARSLDLAESEVHDVDVTPPTPPPPKVVSMTPDSRDDLEVSASPPNWPGVVTWVGVSVAGVGAIGTVVFGARTVALKRDHEADPTASSQSAGHRARALTNVFVAIGIAGGVLLLADAIRYGVAKRRSGRRRTNLRP